jgi:hypothetical protein
MKTAFNPAPRHLLELLDTDWLNQMLAKRWPDAKVHDVSVVETLSTQATKVRLALTVTGGNQDMPHYICIKGALTETSVPSTASIIETQFYQNYAVKIPVRVPRCIYAELNAVGDNGIIVMEDEVQAGSCFLTALNPFNPDDVRDTLEQLALLHAHAWQGSELFEQAEVPRFLEQISAPAIMPMTALSQLLNSPKGDPLPTSVKNAARLQRGLELYAKQVRERPSCLIHGDAHAGNIYRKDGHYGLVDWQILQKGEWAQDIAYHIAAVLSPEDRRLHERGLLKHYLTRLKALGGPELDAEDAWTRYRAAMIYGYYLWTITQKVEPPITNEFFRRLGLAVDELKSFDAIGA